jgi:hypothetical protein
MQVPAPTPPSAVDVVMTEPTKGFIVDSSVVPDPAPPGSTSSEGINTTGGSGQRRKC